MNMKSIQLGLFMAAFAVCANTRTNAITVWLMAPLVLENAPVCTSSSCIWNGLVPAVS